MKNKYNNQKQRKTVAIGLILIAIIAIIFMTVVFINKDDKTEEKNQLNYEETDTGGKSNTSERLAQDKIIKGVTITKSKLVYENGMAKLSSNVVNDSVEKENLRFKIKFISDDGEVISESVGLVGKIKANEVRTIDSYITFDVINAKDVVYEIID